MPALTAPKLEFGRINLIVGILVLDHILYNGFSGVSATMNPVPIYPQDALINYTEEEVRFYVLGHYDDGN